ncbi:RHS repeat protein, partial [Candidatus Woesearchaeota archaeon]|nr:RHS repeat protein [Candidatus Woesearchaeota archaeon]
MTKRGLALLVLIVLVLSSVTVVAASDSECSGFIGFLECFFFGREDALVGGAGVALPNTEGEPTYDDKGRLINFVFEDGQTFSYRYDDNDNVVFEEIDYGGDGNIDVTVESEYNDDGTAVNVRSDYDVDGTVNEISRGEFDADDILVRNEVDSDGNGVIDTIRIRNSNGEMVDDPDFVPENSPSEPSADVSEIGVIDEVNEGADSDETPEPTETEGQIAHTGENSIPITTGRSTGDFRGTYNSENSKAIDGLLTYSNGATFEGTFDNNGNPEEGTYIEDGFSYVGTFLPDGEANTGIYIMDDGRNIIYTDGSSTFSSNAVTSDESVSNNGDEQPSRTETEESTLREQAQQDLGRAYEQLEDRIGWNDEGNLLIDGLPAEIT